MAAIQPDNVIISHICKKLQGPKMYLGAKLGFSTPDCVGVGVIITRMIELNSKTMKTNTSLTLLPTQARNIVCIQASIMQVSVCSTGRG